MKRRLSFLALPALLSLLASGCADDSCLEFAMRRCECCTEELGATNTVEKCRELIEERAVGWAPSDAQLARCEDDIAVLATCEDQPRQERVAFCDDPLPWR